MNKTILRALFLLLPLTAVADGVAIADTAVAPVAASDSVATDARTPAPAELLISYRRLLPLAGGSNFRDLGGYVTGDGRRVKRGMLFRSGAMTGLTNSDIEYLDRFGFRTVVDLRSAEELELYPNRWVAERELSYLSYDYSMVELMKRAAAEGRGQPGDYSAMYQTLTDMLKPQLKMYFQALLNDEVPLVVNCSAGQDRTGVTSALLLSVLGVERDAIIEDYLLSTDFRRPEVEKGDVDLQAAAKTNAFAAMMLRYGQGRDTSRPNPLMTPDGTPFIHFTFEALDARYGGVAAYLEQEVGVSREQQAQLRNMYLQ